MAVKDPNLEVVTGSIVDFSDLDQLLSGIGFVVSMLGDAELQKQKKINTQLVRAVPSDQSIKV